MLQCWRARIRTYSLCHWMKKEKKKRKKHLPGRDGEKLR